MRRKEREISDLNEMTRILDAAGFMTLGLVSESGLYSVPVNFGYRLNEDRLGVQIFVHGAAEGQKISCIKNCRQISFCAVASCEIGAGKEPCEWTSFYESVCGTGTAAILENIDEKRQGLICILNKYGYRGNSDIPLALVEKTCVIKIIVSHISGKAHRK